MTTPIPMFPDVDFRDDFTAEMEDEHAPALFDELTRNVVYYTETGVIKVIRGRVEKSLVVHGDLVDYRGGSTVSEYDLAMTFQAVDMPNPTRGELLIDRNGRHTIEDVVVGLSDEIRTTVRVKPA